MNSELQFQEIPKDDASKPFKNLAAWREYFIQQKITKCFPEDGKVNASPVIALRISGMSFGNWNYINALLFKFNNTDFTACTII